MSWTHLEDYKPKAKMDYRCVLCGLQIAKGTIYVKRIGVADGEFVHNRMHVECEALTKGWTQEDWECSVDEYEFRQNLAAAKAEKPKEKPLELSRSVIIKEEYR